MIPDDLYALALRCSPTVAPATMVAVVKAESGGNPLAIGLNGARLQYYPKNKEQAIAWVNYLDKHGYNYDVGLGQINVRNIRKLGLKPEQLFDACLNLAVAGKILTQNYLRVAKSNKNPQTALRQALSMYNTGNRLDGYTNGYIYKVITSVD